MTIDRIHPLEPVPPGKKSGRSEQVSRNIQSDSISLSAEAVEKAELYKAMELVSAAEELRADRIAELKRKINDPSYISNAIIRATADKVIGIFGL